MLYYITDKGSKMKKLTYILLITATYLTANFTGEIKGGYAETTRTYKVEEIN